MYCEHLDSVIDSCTDGQTRLVNGTLAQEGRVEVCLNGIWGAVCQSGFGQDDAYVVCKALGYNGPCEYSWIVSIIYCLVTLCNIIHYHKYCSCKCIHSIVYFHTDPSVYYHSKYGESIGPIMYSNVNCKGWESQLTECTKTTFPNINCSPQNTVGLLCKDS